MDRRESSDTQQFLKLQIHQTLHSYHTNNRLPRYFAVQGRIQEIQKQGAVAVAARAQPRRVRGHAPIAPRKI